MIIQCGKCGHTEKISKELFVKIIGGALPFGGFGAWVTYLFAGTGLAMPIVLAIMASGVGMLIFKDKIVEWIVNRRYKCPKCDAVQWEA